MQADVPFTLPTLLAALAMAESDVAGFFGSLSQDEFVFRVDSAWTPAEHLEHLNISISAIARGLSMPRWLLRLRFGRSRRASRTYEQLRDDYRARLAAGGRASGKFVPVQENMSGDQRAVRQQEILARWGRVNARLVAAARMWTERDLDQLRLPHPILGKITAREMVFFAIYHDQHHIAGAKSRLPRFTTSSSTRVDVNLDPR